MKNTLRKPAVLLMALMLDIPSENIIGSDTALEVDGWGTRTA